MGIKDFFLNFGKSTTSTSSNEINSYALPFTNVSELFYGEQEYGAYDGPIYYDVDYYNMAKRAYTLVTINEFARIAISRLAQFVVGTGLRLHPEPARNFLKKKFNININQDFSKDIQELWELFECDKNVSVTKEDTIHSLANLVFYNAFVSGDVLVVKRVKNGNLEYQVINGMSVYTTKTKSDRGNDIIDGVEVDKNGKHIKYYVTEKDGKITEIPAYDSKGRKIAWLVYSSDKRLNAVRGYSPLGAIMQKLNKIGQYANSEVIAADANARFAAIIEHDKDSTGQNIFNAKQPLLRSLREQQQQQQESPPPKPDSLAERFRAQLRKIPQGIFFNVPRGQKMSGFDTKRPNVNYVGFLDGSMKYIFAAIGIPFEIAILLFSNNFSASRAALKIFELIVEYFRKFSVEGDFYQIIYEQFFEIECLKHNINAPDYLKLKNMDGYLDNAFTKAKFIGKKIPHIDEVKEVNAIIAKLKAGLITYEQALESLGNSVNFDTLIDTRKREEEKIRNAGLAFEAVFSPVETKKGNKDDD